MSDVAIRGEAASERFMPRKSAKTKKRSAPACDCGPGGRALGVDADLKASSITRLKRAEGQVRGIARMVDEDRYCADVIIQIAAAQESLRAVAKNLLKTHLKHCAVAAMLEDGAKRDDMIEELLELVAKVAR